MPPIIRTLDQLLALYVDNDVGAISAGDGRDEIASCFGYFSSLRNPGPLDDREGTGGSGGFFDTGSKWINLLTFQVFVCMDGTPMAAVWKGQAYDGEPAGGRLTGTWPTPVLTPTGVVADTYGDSTHYATFTVQADGTLTDAAEFAFPPSSPLLGRITSGPAQNPNLQSPLIAAHWSSISDTLSFDNNSDFVHVQPFMLIVDSGGTAVGFVKQVIINPSTHVVTCILFANASTSGPGNIRTQPLHCEWIEQQFDSDTGALSDKPGGIVGTLASNPAVNMETNYVDMAGVYVELWKRGTVGATTLWEFTKYGNDVVSGGTTNLGPINVTTPTSQPPGGTPPPGTLSFDIVNNTFIFYYNAGLSVSIPVSGIGQGDVLTGTEMSGSTYHTVLHLAAGPIGIHGSLSFKCIAGVNISFRLTLTDFAGTQNQQVVGLGIANQPASFDIDARMAALATANMEGPCRDLLVEVEDGPGGAGSSWRVAYGTVGG